jgi:hypothetical protein
LAYGGRIMQQKHYMTSDYTANLASLLARQNLKIENKVIEHTINTSSAQILTPPPEVKEGALA